MMHLWENIRNNDDLQNKMHCDKQWYDTKSRQISVHLSVKFYNIMHPQLLALRQTNYLNLTEISNIVVISGAKSG